MQKEPIYFLTSEKDKLFEIRKTRTKQKISPTYLYRTILIKTSTDQINIPSPF